MLWFLLSIIFCNLLLSLSENLLLSIIPLRISVFNSLNSLILFISSFLNKLVSIAFDSSNFSKWASDFSILNSLAFSSFLIVNSAFFLSADFSPNIASDTQFGIRGCHLTIFSIHSPIPLNLPDIQSPIDVIPALTFSQIILDNSFIFSILKFFLMLSIKSGKNISNNSQIVTIIPKKGTILARGLSNFKAPPIPLPIFLATPIPLSSNEFLTDWTLPDKPLILPLILENLELIEFFRLFTPLPILENFWDSFCLILLKLLVIFSLRLLIEPKISLLTPPKETLITFKRAVLIVTIPFAILLPIPIATLPKPLVIAHKPFKTLEPSLNTNPPKELLMLPKPLIAPHRPFKATEPSLNTKPPKELLIPNKVFKTPLNPLDNNLDVPKRVLATNFKPLKANLKVFRGFIIIATNPMPFIIFPKLSFIKGNTVFFMNGNTVSFKNGNTVSFKNGNSLSLIKGYKSFRSKAPAIILPKAPIRPFLFCGSFKLSLISFDFIITLLPKSLATLNKFFGFLECSLSYCIFSCSSRADFCTL